MAGIPMTQAEFDQFCCEGDNPPAWVHVPEEFRNSTDDCPGELVEQIWVVGDFAYHTIGLSAMRVFWRY